MAKSITPITCYVPTAERALELAHSDKDSEAMISGPGTLKFHLSIARHGAGEFKTLYVPAALRGKWKEPAGGEIIEMEI
jgi:hypothetical protein